MIHLKQPISAGDFTMPKQSSASRSPFHKRTHKDHAGRSLPYRLLQPRAKRGEARPMLLFLHGAGERGSDNEKQLVWGSEFLLAAAREHGCVCVVPQCPEGKKWAELDWSKPRHRQPVRASETMRLVIALVESLCGELKIDRSRLYVIGLSMGGYGTWDLVTRFPKKFAAAVPVCGGGDATKAKRLAKLPLWAFHGALDTGVPVRNSRAMIDAIRRAGGLPGYTEYPGTGHNAWSPALADAKLFEWLFSQRRSSPRLS
jgi:predicted peptidase